MADGWQWDADDFEDDGGGEDAADGDAIKVREAVARRPGKEFADGEFRSQFGLRFRASTIPHTSPFPPAGRTTPFTAAGCSTPDRCDAT